MMRGGTISALAECRWTINRAIRPVGLSAGDSPMERGLFSSARSNRQVT